MGRKAPHARQTNPLKWVGEMILQKATPLVPLLQQSLEVGAKTHAFSEKDFQDIRETLMPEGEDSTVEPGQQFYVEVISHMAKQAGDPDWR